MTLNFWKYLITTATARQFVLLPSQIVSVPRRNSNAIRAFSATLHNHNLNARYSAVLLREFCSSFSEHG
jgi:hypothetical protein